MASCPWGSTLAGSEVAFEDSLASGLATRTAPLHLLHLGIVVLEETSPVNISCFFFWSFLVSSSHEVSILDPVPQLSNLPAAPCSLREGAWD